MSRVCARRRTPLSVGICSITTGVYPAGVEEESCRRGILLGQYHNDLGYTDSNVELVNEIFILSSNIYTHALSARIILIG